MTKRKENRTGQSAYAAAAFVLLFVFWLQMFLAIPQLSITSDEVAHLPAGYTYWKTRDFRLNPEHPPLAKLISALPLLAIDPHLELTWPEWQASREYAFGYGFLSTNNVDNLLFWGRIPLTILATLGGLVVFLWARDMFGPACGIFALALFAFSPNLLAHAMLVTTDVPVGVFMTLTLYLYWKHLKNAVPGPVLAFCTGLATGAAMACKFSGALLPLVILAFSASRVCFSSEPRKQAASEARFLALAAIGAVLVIEAAYLFTVPPWIYFQNMRLVNANHNPNHEFYLFGRFSRSGWWYYFPAALAVKATIPLLIALVLSSIHLAMKRFADIRGEMLILVSTLSYAGAVVIGADEIGLRYLLPVFPLLFIWTSRLVLALKTKPAGIALAAMLIAWQMTAALRAFPNYIPYFNEIAGGAKNGIYYLDDSNVDWGQATRQAADYIRSHDLQNVRVLPFSPLDNLDHYGVHLPQRNDVELYRAMLSNAPREGVYIVSSHYLTRLMHARPEWNPKNAVDRIADSLWVFRF